MTHTLIGMYDSPYVRRVAVTMRFYGIPYEHRPWSVFGDADKVVAVNPLGRVPVLLLDHNEALIESGAILDYLDECAGPEQALTPTHGPGRRASLMRTSVAMGACDKAVALVYEHHKRATTDTEWEARLLLQLDRARLWLESALPELGGKPDQSQLSSAVMMRFVAGYHPDIAPSRPLPRLQALSDACEAMPEFQAAPFST